MSTDQQPTDYRNRTYDPLPRALGDDLPLSPGDDFFPAKMNCANCGGNDFAELPGGGFVCTHCGTRYDEFLSRYQADMQAEQAARSVLEDISTINEASRRHRRAVFATIMIITVVVIAVFAVVIGVINRNARLSSYYDESDFNSTYIVETPVLVDNELCTVTLQGYVGGGPSLDMVFFAESKADGVQVNIDDVVVNGYALSSNGYAYLSDKGDERQMTLYLDFATMKFIAPDGPTEISLRIVTTDGSLSAHEITSDLTDAAGVHVEKVTVYPTGKTAADVVVPEYALPDEAVTFVDDGGVFATVLYCGYVPDWDSRVIDYGLYLVNDTDERLALELGNVRVNGEYTQNDEEIILPPHTRAVRHLSFWLVDENALEEGLPNSVEVAYKVRQDTQFSESMAAGTLTLSVALYDSGSNPRYQLY